MKRLFVVFTIALFTKTAFCYQLYWFSSAAIKKPSQKIAELFNKTHKDKVVLINGGTGQVLQQMILSKKGDIYTCIDPKFFKIAQEKGLILEYTSFIKLTPVIGLSQKGQNKIKTFNDIFKNGITIAAGNPKTMALGKTYMHILNKLSSRMATKLKNNVKVKAINISQIINYLKQDTVDAGLVFKSTAKINGFDYVEIPKEFNQIKKGYIAKISFSKNKKAQDDLYRFILNHPNIYTQFGFDVIH
ncbi:molybdate ABC transporter substrate-binding protein [Hippea maritima]|uniref:Extracellular solute-binding protein family 1 n=1 Tax=Hippea maritima (strain ATCC 700847 / DSM 10411 / MH2) TaxID=760142 RepID=F2LXG2_HIPMA|nr:molybdate ABC transporter substrate-binding protein [Hippea maritima]AEA34276.1 extracellular solute-binding protein family 1 [Hippea maritima DSM 10411]